MPEILARPLTDTELQSAELMFNAHMTDLARDEQSWLSTQLYHLANWAPNPRLRIASGLDCWTGIPPNRFLGSQQSITAVMPTNAALDIDLSEHLAEMDNNLPIPMPEMCTAQIEYMPVASVSLGWTGPTWDERHFPAFYVAGRLLGGTHDSILMTELRRRNGWSYSPWSAVRLRPNCTLLEIQARVGRRNIDQAREIIVNAISRIPSVNQSDLRTAYASSLGQLVIGISSQAGLAGTVNHYDFIGIGLPGLDDIFSVASQVTSSDLGKVADRYLRADQAIDINSP